MRPFWVTDWLAALKSGRYKKGRHALRTKDNEYCCLGVLCELHGLVPEEPTVTCVDYRYGVDKKTSLLPKELCYKLNLCSLGFDTADSISVASINDQSDTFEPVIKAIEEKYPE